MMQVKFGAGGPTLQDFFKVTQGKLDAEVRVGTHKNGEQYLESGKFYWDRFRAAFAWRKDTTHLAQSRQEAIAKFRVAIDKAIADRNEAGSILSTLSGEKKLMGAFVRSDEVMAKSGLQTDDNGEPTNISFYRSNGTLTQVLLEFVDKHIADKPSDPSLFTKAMSVLQCDEVKPFLDGLEKSKILGRLSPEQCETVYAELYIQQNRASVGGVNIYRKEWSGFVSRVDLPECMVVHGEKVSKDIFDRISSDGDIMNQIMEYANDPKRWMELPQNDRENLYEKIAQYCSDAYGLKKIDLKFFDKPITDGGLDVGCYSGTHKCININTNEASLKLGIESVINTLSHEYTHAFQHAMQAKSMLRMPPLKFPSDMDAARMLFHLNSYLYSGTDAGYEQYKNQPMEKHAMKVGNDTQRLIDAHLASLNGWVLCS